MSEKPRIRLTADGLSNVVSGMGTDRDQRAFSRFSYGAYQDFAELEAAYGESWIARAVVDIPVDDATREWRSFTHDMATDIQRAEQRIKLSDVTQQAFKWGGLYGGAGVLMITDQSLDQPLRVDRIKKGSLKRLLVLDRMYLSGQDFNYTDVLAENFLLPEHYLIYGGTQRVHHSHFVRAPGAKLPLRIRQINGGWDDSQLRRCMEDLKDAVSAKSGIAALIQSANVDVIRKEGLSDILSAGDMDGRVSTRYALFNMMKSVHRLGLLDSTEEFTRNAASFGGLGEVLHTLMEWVSGAARIPMTRLFGVQAKGLGDSGQGDMNNYYNTIRSAQESDYRPFLERIDQVLIRSATGNYPEDLRFEWNPLSQPSDTELAQQQLAFAQADDVRIQQGVVRQSQVARKLKEQSVYAIDDKDISRMEADEEAYFNGNSDLPDASRIFGGGHPGGGEEAPGADEGDSAGREG